MSKELRMTINPSAPLGKKSPYPNHYDKSLLFPVCRKLQRDAMKIAGDTIFFGFDVWNAYELFWLNSLGKPIRSMASFMVPASSLNICESKSVKLYLNSFNHEKFSHEDEVKNMIASDLSEICQSPVEVFLNPKSLYELDSSSISSYRCLDDLDISINCYQRHPDFLRVDTKNLVSEKIVSHLFKSHCLCTQQPDMGSIFVEYKGPKIDDAGLLAYLISYRDHVGFSENCIEQIFIDIYQRTRPEKLSVFGRFTRRGGIDINPYRFTHERAIENIRMVYQ
jgi:7-cyano-7-deazaguanine reductase